MIEMEVFTAIPREKATSRRLGTRHVFTHTRKAKVMVDWGQRTSVSRACPSPSSKKQDLSWTRTHEDVSPANIREQIQEIAQNLSMIQPRKYTLKIKFEKLKSKNAI